MFKHYHAFDQRYAKTNFAAIRNVAPSQLADTALFDFSGLHIERPSRIGMVNLWDGESGDDDSVRESA